MIFILYFFKMCVHVYIYIYVYRCLCMQLEARGQCWVFHLSFSTLFLWDRVSHWTWNLLILLGWLAMALQVSPVPTFPADYRHKLLLRYWGPKLRSSGFYGKHFINLAISSTPLFPYTQPHFPKNILHLRIRIVQSASINSLETKTLRSDSSNPHS